MKLVSWNVNGLRSVRQKGLDAYLERSKPNILCLQETKVSDDVLEQILPEYCDHQILACCAKKKGYSGVATFVCDKSVTQHQIGMGIPSYDDEGRTVITDHGDFLLYNAYFPSGTSGEERQGFKYQFLDAFADHLRSLSPKDRKRLVICGDFNICHKEIDIHHPKTAEKLGLTGFLPDERAWMDKFVSLGFVDTFRQANGDLPQQYTWWSYRAGARSKNLGWRIDYFFVSKELQSKIAGAGIEAEVTGSDHCPIWLELKL